jgi:hypothetical protein
VIRLQAERRIERVIVRTLESLPPDATHWSSRGMSRVSERFKIDKKTVSKWRRRFVEHRLDGLHEPRSGAPRAIEGSLFAFRLAGCTVGAQR